MVAVSARQFCLVCWTCLITCMLFGADAHASLRHIPRFRPPPSNLKSTPHGQLGERMEVMRRDLISQCEEKWRDATLDHFTWSPGDQGRTTFKQRYFVCKKHWGYDDDDNVGPIFFYLGNEADVTLYLNATGLMWENAPRFKAMLVFAEHRYYGQSLPYGKDVKKHMQYLGTEQALADYAQLIEELKEQYNASHAPVIGFGGSYGGMLATWMRIKYPHLLKGAVAASAPIWNFMNEEPPFDPTSFAKGVTWDASEGGGAVPACADNVRKTWKVMKKLGDSDEGRDMLAQTMKLCEDVKLNDKDDVIQLRDWLAAAWDYMAMGNFPYPSGYILNGQGQLPAFPVRVACKVGMQGRHLTDTELLQGMIDAVGVYYNHTGDVSCYNFNEGVNPEGDEVLDFWSYQYCTEMFMPEAKDGVHDMFWDEPWDPDAIAEGCKLVWDVTPRRNWAQTEWGGRHIESASRIVFSNGLLDPWHGGGVLDDINDDLPALIIPEGAHHLDLMFSHENDPPSVIKVRKAQRKLIKKWIKKARKEQRKRAKNNAQLHPKDKHSALGLGKLVLGRTGSKPASRN